MVKAVVGANWGDEGKGNAVRSILRTYDEYYRKRSCT